MTELWTSPTKHWDLCTPERQEKLRKAWAAGNLRWKLDPSQQSIYDAIYASHKTVRSAPERIFALDVSRQSGKDFTMSCLAIEQCLRNRRQIRIPYGCPTKETVHDLLVPTMFQIFQDCPPELMPTEIRKGTFRTNAHRLSWPWGAQIVLVGVDLHPDWLRGPASEIFFLTEPGFIDGLEGLMSGILLPQMLTYPHGWGVMASTPPETPGHPWSQKYIPAAKRRGMYVKRVITDCPRFDPDQVKGMIQELGGRDSTRVKRELFCEHIVESTLAVVPEFTPAKEGLVVKNYAIPAWRDTFVSIDPGFSHATGAIFGFPDFERGFFMVEGDFAVQRQNSREVSRLVKAREWQLWGREPVKPSNMTDSAWIEELAFIRACFYPGLEPPNAPVKSHGTGGVSTRTTLRVSDTDARLIADMHAEHGIQISPADKDDSDAALNSFRIALQGMKWRIHERCVNLIEHLEQATWNKGRTKFSESAGGGHFDCIPAAVYLNRKSQMFARNPFPPQTFSKHTHFIPAGQGGRTSKTGQALARLFGRK